MNVYLPGARLPSTYQEVEWIGRNGNNYIETGWIPTTNFTVKVGYKIADSGYRYVILSQYGGGAYNHAVALEVNSGNVSNNTVRFYCGNTPTTTQFYSSNSLNLNSFNDITITAPGTINVNGTTTTNSSMYTGTYDNKTCRLFIDNDTSFSTFSHNSFISYCKIYEGSTLVRDFIPCYRKSDSVIGLYDLANNQFYTNSGTGTFTKGNDVTMAVLKNAYIGEVWTPGSNTIAYFPLAEDQLDKSGNGYTLTTTGTKQTIGYQFSGSNIQINGTSDVANMMSVWIKIVSFGSGIGDSATMIRIGGAMRYNWYHSISSSNKKFQIYNSSSSSQIYSSAQNTDTGNRYHLLFGVSGTTNGNYVGWINGNKVFSGTTNTNLGGGDWIIKIINNNTTLIASDLIVENRIRTDAEVLSYYNNTKSNYGL